MCHILALKWINLEKLIETLLKWKKMVSTASDFPHTQGDLSHYLILQYRTHVSMYPVIKQKWFLILLLSFQRKSFSIACKKYVSNGIFGDRSIFLTNPSSAHKRLACKKLLQLYNLTTCQSCFVQFPWSSIRHLCIHNDSFTSEKRTHQKILCGGKKYLHIDKIFTKACLHSYLSKSLLNLSYS